MLLKQRIMVRRVGVKVVCVRATKVIYVNNNGKLVDPNDRVFRRIGRTQNNISFSWNMFPPTAKQDPVDQ